MESCMDTRQKLMDRIENGPEVYMTKVEEDGFIRKNHLIIHTTRSTGWRNKKNAFNRNDWNQYKIKCLGDQLKIWVNGIKTTDLKDNADRKGFIAIQHHGEKGQIYRFRKLKLKKLLP